MQDCGTHTCKHEASQFRFLWMQGALIHSSACPFTTCECRNCKQKINCIFQPKLLDSILKNNPSQNRWIDSLTWIFRSGLGYELYFYKHDMLSAKPWKITNGLIRGKQISRVQYFMRLCGTCASLQNEFCNFFLL